MEPIVIIVIFICFLVFFLYKNLVRRRRKQIEHKKSLDIYEQKKVSRERLEQQRQEQESLKKWYPPNVGQPLGIPCPNCGSINNRPAGYDHRIKCIDCGKIYN
jgi:hypothetical protein